VAGVHRVSLRGELLHVFISYRVSTEGLSGNGLSLAIYNAIRELSVQEQSGLALPESSWGVWPKFAKTPIPYRREQAKVFLDRRCLRDGQNWVEGFVQGCRL
jgi:hypothetical protein